MGIIRCRRGRVDIEHIRKTDGSNNNINEVNGDEMKDEMRGIKWLYTYRYYLAAKAQVCRMTWNIHERRL